MRLRRGLVLGLVAGAVASVGAFAAHEMAMARQKPIAVVRFLAGYFNGKGKFVPIAGRGASNVDRNAVLMFVLSGAVDTGPKIQATLPLTLSEQGELAALTIKVRDGNASAVDDRRFRELGGDERVLLEPGVIVRRKSTDRAAQIVATGSVSADSVRIVATSGGGEALAEGVFFKVTKRNGRRNRIRRFIFHPQYTVATFGRPGEIDYNPEGFEANTTYAISMNGGPTATNLLTVVTNLDGSPLGSPFNTTITTTDTYLQDFTRPEIRETSPNDGSVNVASDADVEVTFSEPMNIASFRPPRSPGDPSATVQMRYTVSPINGVLGGRDILAQVRVKPQTAGNVVQLRPLQGFGRGPYEVEVTITAGVTDLSGNNIIRQQQFVFSTEQDDTAEDFADLREFFEDVGQQDTQFFSNTANLSGDNAFAEWNSKANPGLLTTTVGAATFETRGPTPTSQVNVWFSRAVRWQSLFPSNDMGGRPRTLTGFAWHQRGAQLNLTYPNTQVKLGHANDVVAGGGFPGGATPPGPSASYYRETPVTVTPSINYTIPATAGNPNWVPGPAWGGTWNFDGTNSVILEVEHFGNGTTASSETWGMDGTYSLNGMTYSLFQDNPPVIASVAWYMSVRWSFLAPGAEAQSTWYNAQQPAVRWVPQQLVPFSQPQGTSVSIRWQGAKADLNNPSLLDTTTITPWTTDIRTLAGNPFVRWHVELVNNVATGQSPTIDTLTMPFTFR